jgi:hypothetical protein
MDFPKDISKMEDGTIAMYISEDVGMFILPSGKIITTEYSDENNNKMYNRPQDYPDKPAYCGQINWQTYEPEGRGTFTYYGEHEASYDGYVRAGKPYGNGILTYKNGLFEDGFFMGTTFTGTQTLACGTVITGFWDKGSLDDVTRVEFIDGRRIVETKSHEDNRFFIGKYSLPGQGVFIGTIWKTGFEPRQGTMKFIDGRCYMGECRFNVTGESRTCFAAHGRGKMILADGASYIGKWVRGIVCDNFQGTLHLVGENAGEIVGHPHVGVMAKYFIRDDFVGFAISASTAVAEQAKVEVASKAQESEESDDDSEDDDPSPVRQLLLTMQEQVRLRKVQLQEEAWRKHALAYDEENAGVEVEEDSSDASSEADEELVQRKMERTHSAAEDNAVENLNPRARCGTCQKQFGEEEKYFKCSICEKQCYCNDVCQRKHWQEHKKDCKKVVEIVEESEDD